MKMCYFPVTTIPIWQSVYVPFNRTHQLAGFITKHSCTFVVPLWNQPIISKGELLKRKEMLLQLNAEGWNSSRLNISKWSFWTVFEDEQTKHHFWVPHEVQGIWNAKNLQLGHNSLDLSSFSPHSWCHPSIIYFHYLFLLGFTLEWSDVSYRKLLDYDYLVIWSCYTLTEMSSL